jgi:ABC-2 type transport system permease protein
VIRLVSTELFKLRTMRFTWALIAAALALAPLGTALNISVFVKLLPGLDLGSEAGLHSLLGNGANGSILVLALGIVSVAGEYRHGTIAHAFLITPRRGHVIVAKACAAAITGVVVGAVAAALAGVVTVSWLVAHAIPIQLSAVDTALFLMGGVAATALTGAFGVGLGAMLRGQVAAILVAVVVEPLVEPLIAQWLPSIGKYLPTSALGALMGRAGSNLLAVWQGGLVYTVYVVVLVGVGILITNRRSIT